MITDTDRMNWLVGKCVEVRRPARWGSHPLFTAQEISDEEDEQYESDLRQQIDRYINDT